MIQNQNRVRVEAAIHVYVHHPTVDIHGGGGGGGIFPPLRTHFLFSNVQTF